MNGHAVQGDLSQIVAPVQRKFDWPEVTEKGGPKGRSQKNIGAFLEHLGATLAFNELAYCTVIRRNGRETLLTDEAARGLWLKADALGLASGERYFISVVENAARQNSFHPVRDYLNRLEWDGIPRLDTWLSGYMDAEDTELNRACLAPAGFDAATLYCYSLWSRTPPERFMMSLRAARRAGRHSRPALHGDAAHRPYGWGRFSRSRAAFAPAREQSPLTALVSGIQTRSNLPPDRR